MRCSSGDQATSSARSHERPTAASSTPASASHIRAVRRSRRWRSAGRPATTHPTDPCLADRPVARRPAQTDAGRDAVLAMVGVLRALNTAIKGLDQSVVARLDRHPDSQIFTSLPRSGRINAAQMLAEWGEGRAAYLDPDAAVTALAGLTGDEKRDFGDAHE
jgi:transposase